jgi:hypothetical protein
MAECGHESKIWVHCTSSRCAGKTYCDSCYIDVRHPCYDPAEGELL